MHRLISEDTKIHNEYQLVMYLYECFISDKQIDIDFHLEGPCCSRNNLYAILNEFCNKTKFQKDRIRIHTGNALEKHNEYRVIFKPEYWYEVELIKKWLETSSLTLSKYPTKHFGIFIGRASWSRNWVSTLLYRYKEKTIQTFHSGFDQNYVVAKSNNTTDILDLDNLNVFKCNIIPEVTNFLGHCPINQINDIELIQNTKMFIAANNNNCFPIQHPANLNILQWYNNIFVDIVCETRVVGDIFFVTEKTWRCIIAQRPFIIVGPPHFLSNLKRLGFKTFNDFWNEGYDDYPPSHRIGEIEVLLNKLANKSMDELHQMLHNMQPILEHNYKTFKNLNYQTIKEAFNE
jgi:hypothetical protein